jgi:cardiolipin synthase
MGMTPEDSYAFATACTKLVGQVAANQSLADAIIASLRSGSLTPRSGPVSIGNVLGGAPGSHNLKAFLKAWGTNVPHMSALDVTAVVQSSLDCYRIAQGQAHMVDAVLTGPEVAGSEVRRTEAVVNEILASANSDLLIVGYWLVTSTTQIKALIDLLIEKARAGVRVRFVFDPGEKSSGLDNFAALSERWPSDFDGAKREVYSWSEGLVRATSLSGLQYDRKLHAKVIVADRHDALVTSANLTHAGMLENLEMGLRIQGVMAGAVVRHFDLLIQEGILEQRV